MACSGLPDLRRFESSPAHLYSAHMPYHVTVGWKIFWRLPPACHAPAPTTKTKSFEARTGKSVLRDVGGSIQAEFFPTVLEPTGPFFSKVSRAARDASIALEKTRFTAAGVDEHAGLTFAGTFAIHVYGNQLCVPVELDSISIAEVERLIALSDFSKHPNLKSFVVRIADVVGRELCADNLPNAADPKVYPCTKIVADARDQPVSLGFLTELLTRHTSPNLDVVEEVYSKNRKHQVDGTQVLLDRQGLVAYAPPTAHADERASCDRRYRSCSALIELAAAGQRLLSEREQSELLPALATLTLDPKSSIPNSVSASRAWQLLVSEFNLDAARQYGQAPVPTASDKQSLKDTPTRVLCIVAATVELDAVQEYLKGKFGPEKTVRLDRGADYYLRYVDTSQGVTWCVVPLSFQGQVEAASDTRYLCTLLEPTLLLMVGMCMSMKSSVAPGTVVIPNEVMVFDHERLTAQGTQVRPHGDRVDNGLFKLARIFASTNKFSFRVVTDKGLASAMSKVENPTAELVTFIQKSFPDAAAFDMEGWGFYRAGAGQQCLWIKAVADRGEAQGAESAGQDAKRDVQSTVTEHAIEFAVKLVDGYLRVEDHEG